MRGRTHGREGLEGLGQMRYADSLMADGEVVVRRARQHWLSLFLDARRGWVVGVVGILVLIVGLLARAQADPWQTAGQLLAVVALVAIAIGIVDVAYHLLRWRAQDYLVTNRRVIQVEGLLNKRAADSSLEKINDAVLDQNLVARMFGYGDLVILTASESAIDRFHMLARAAEFKREMLNQKHSLEIELARPNTPPLRVDVPRRPETPTPRAPDWMDAQSTVFPGSPDASRPASVAPATSPAGSAAGGPAPAPVPAGWSGVAGSGTAAAVSASPPPAGPATDPQQVTATLGRLADLRDRGAITPEEYEAKKAELLARL